MKNIAVALDGPAGAGKSTVAKEIAKKFGFVYVDTGAMYRAIAVKCINLNFDVVKNKDEIISMLANTDIEIKYIDGTQHIILDGKDVTGELRTENVSMVASAVSAVKEVRLCLVELQRKLAEKTSVVMDGRDIGTYVLPNAELKIFLTASPEERAKRRCLEYEQKGVSFDFDEVLKDITTRDYNDSHREFAPLKQADDAILINTDGIPFLEVVDIISDLIKEKVNVL